MSLDPQVRKNDQQYALWKITLSSEESKWLRLLWEQRMFSMG
ncbi:MULTISPECIES: hypothetical protein [Paraliobacillus]|nr:MULTISPECIES: hypothetical protein [Paraliobacillus]